MKTRLAFGGRLGDAPLSVDAEAVRIGFGGSTAAPRVGLALGPAALALKQPDGETRLDLTELTAAAGRDGLRGSRSDEHTSELQSLLRISYAVFCLKKKNHLKPTIQCDAPVCNMT